MSNILSDSPLFRGITSADIVPLLDRLGAGVRRIPTGTAVFREGDTKTRFGVLLEGALEMFEMDVEGRRSMVGVAHPPECFALSFAFAEVARHPATVVAVEDSRILSIRLAAVKIPLGRVVDPVYGRFLMNLAHEICTLSWNLRMHAFVLSRRSMRGRLLAYLKFRSREGPDCRTVTVPFNRQGLADYLCVDRSALSALIGRLVAEGVFECHRNRFTFRHSSPRRI